METATKPVSVYVPPAGELDWANKLLCSFDYPSLQRPNSTLSPGVSLEKSWGTSKEWGWALSWMVTQKKLQGHREQHGAGKVWFLQRIQNKTRRIRKMKSGLIYQEPGQGQDNRKDVKNTKSGSCRDESKTKSVWPTASGCGHSSQLWLWSVPSETTFF